MWQQLNVYKYADVVKTFSCDILTKCQNRGKNVIQVTFYHGIIVGAGQGGLCVSETADHLGWDFHAQQSLEFAENGAQNKKHQVNSSSACKNALMRGVRGKGIDRSKLTGR